MSIEKSDFVEFSLEPLIKRIDESVERLEYEYSEATLDEYPPCVRTLTVTAGGTAGDIKAGSVRVNGTNYADEEIYEDFT